MSDAQKARERRSLSFRLLLGGLKGCLFSGGPSLEAAQYLLQKARDGGQDPKQVWDEAVALLAVFPNQPKPPWTYEQASAPLAAKPALQSHAPTSPTE